MAGFFLTTVALRISLIWPIAHSDAGLQGHRRESAG